MSVDLELNAEIRGDMGKGASRRLRRTGKVPAILYGAKKDPQALTLNQNAVIKQLENEAFYSQILTIKVDGRSEQAILRDLQRHPYKPSVLHMDFLRISADQAIRVNIPLHFINEENCHGVKQEGGTIGHLMNDVEVICLPKDLPEFIEVDVIDLVLGGSIHLSELTLSEGVELAQLAQGSEYDAAVVNVHHTRMATEEEETEETGEEEAGPDAATPDAPEED